jgi:glutathione S-transferase
MQRLGLDIELRDTLRNPAYRAELVAGGGMTQVPCLRVGHEDGRVEWMYESLDIIDYLKERFDPGR